MLQSVRIAACSLLFIVSLQICSAPIRADDQKATGEKTVLTDRDRLQGSWYLVRAEIGGKLTPGVLGMSLVFTNEMMDLGDLPEEYHINEKSEPKELDHGFFRGIYKLDEEKLTLCLTPSSNSSRPTAFATTAENDQRLLEFRRSKPIPKDAPDVAFDKELAQAIATCVKLLEAKRDEEVIRHITPRKQFEQIPPEGLKEAVKSLGERRDALKNTLSVLSKVKPQIVTKGKVTVATFDLRKFDIKGGVPHKMIRFVKIDGKWCVEGPSAQSK